MGIAPVTAVSSDVSVLGVLHRGTFPIDTRRSDASKQSLTPVDRFQPSARTPLAADRLLAGRQASAEAPMLLGQSQDDGGLPFADTNAKNAQTRPSADVSMPETAEKAKADETGSSGGKNELSEEEQQQVAKLKQRDTEVRAHEQAHLGAAGGLASGGASFSYQTGPDGKRYAVGGEVQIAMREGRTPEETIRNAEQVQAAALAPANPSSTDMQTAAAAARMAQQARQELARENGAASSSAGNSGKGKSESGSSRDPSTGTAEGLGLRAGTERPEEKGAESSTEAPRAGWLGTSTRSASVDGADDSMPNASLDSKRKTVPGES